MSARQPVLGDRFVLVFSVTRNRWSIEDRQTGDVEQFRSRAAAVAALRPGTTTCYHIAGQRVCEWCPGERPAPTRQESL
jgi:hypothetical protein